MRIWVHKWNKPNKHKKQETDGKYTRHNNEEADDDDEMMVMMMMSLTMIEIKN